LTRDVPGGTIDVKEGGSMADAIEETTEVDRATEELENLIRWRTVALLDEGFTYDQVVQINPQRTDVVHIAHDLLVGHTHEQVAWLLEEVRP
jgi:hypothetical protein